jgi:glyoxylase-like metal-dependent hydrolase (beta-lactamase superfamily II)
VSLADEPVTGIHRLPVPTPFAVGPINCYLLTGDPLTLVDTGPNSGTSLDFLERGLAELGVRIEDLELVVLTHQHMDHEGLLEIVTRRSGAEVAAFAPLMPWIAEYPASAAGDDAYAQSVMTASGVPDDLSALLAVLAAGVRAYGSHGTITRPLSDGDGLTMGGREFTVHHRPGHSRSDLVFHEVDSGVLIGGDHLLARISSNALVSRPLDGNTGGPRPKPLIAYGNSLRATREMDVSQVLTGHGEAVTEHVALIDARLNDIDRRARKILGLVADKPLTAHEIAREMWGEIALKQAYLTLSEVLGHLDLLLEAGTVTETQAEGIIRFGVA